MASGLSGIVLLVCMITMGLIHLDVKQQWNKLDIEMDEFKVLTNDLWRDLAVIGNQKYRLNRHKRQQYDESGDKGKTSSSAGVNANPPIGIQPPSPPIGGSSPPGTSTPPEQCGCKHGSDNKCPAGPPGPKGIPGYPGPDGSDGLDGVQGLLSFLLHYWYINIRNFYRN
uniref:Nematode cuticle collagen N-terminal domain-containing protein n=1 Tax=Panagrolaimus superbus TaxID=310955 RepID=A0A914Z237_9BILA